MQFDVDSKVKFTFFKQPFHFLRNGDIQNIKEKTIAVSPRFEILGLSGELLESF